MISAPRFLDGGIDGGRLPGSFYPIKKCEYIRQELPVTPEMSAYAMVGLAQQELAKRAPYQISHLVLRGYRDADIVLPVQELAQLNRVVRVVDETEPDYPFDQLKQRYDGTLLAQYIETLEAYPDAASGRKALYYGVQAMLNAMGKDRRLRMIIKEVNIGKFGKTGKSEVSVCTADQCYLRSQ
mgnify:CR=1 FL=1